MMKWLWNSGLLFWIALYLSVSTVSVQAETVAELSPLLVGVMNGLFGGALLLARIPIGIISGKMLHQKPLLFFGLFLIALGNAIVPLVPHPATLLISRFILGAGAGFWIVYSILYVNHHRKDELPKAMAQITLTYGMGITIGGIAGGILAEYWGWHAPFWAGLAVALISMAVLLPEQEKVVFSYSFHRELLLAKLKNTRLILVSFLAALLFFLGTSTVWGFTTNFAFQEFGATPLQLGIIALAMLGPYALGIRFSYVPRNKFGVKNIVAGGLGMAGAATLLIPLSGSILGLSLLHVVVGAGLGIVFSTLMSLSVEDLPIEHRNEAMGIFQTIYAAGFLLGPFISGVISENFGISYIFLANGGLTLLAVLLLIATPLGSVLAKTSQSKEP
ncbi:MAG: MFS transporter [bacterium]|nr:MFS transporter [bacterium]